jgi:hypothetical protein
MRLERYPRRLSLILKTHEREDQMQGWVCRTSALAVTMLFASCISAAAQDDTAREKLRAQSNEFRKEVIRVTDGVYVAVGYSASNVILIQGDTGSIIWIRPRTQWPQAPSGPRSVISSARRCMRSSTLTPTRTTLAGRAFLPKRIILTSLAISGSSRRCRTSAAPGAMAATSSAWRCRSRCTSTRAFKWNMGGSRLLLGKGTCLPRARSAATNCC